MSAESDFVRRERITDALLEFERRIRDGTLPVNHSECWQLVPNRDVDPAPLRYETREEIPLLRVVDPAAPNHACLACDLFGRSHCCGGLVFLYCALRDAGVEDPMRWLAVEIEPGLWLPDWELMRDNTARIAHRLRDYFEAHLTNVSAAPVD